MTLPKESPVSDATLSLVGDTAPGFVRQRQAPGCDKCLHTGFKGRQGIYEMIPIDEEVRSLVLQKVSSERLRDYAKSQGYRTMFEHGLELAAQGKTTLEEVLRVTRL